MAKTQMRMAPAPESTYAPLDNGEILKEQLGRRLSALMAEKDMSQSDLARAADLPRGLISTYVRSRSLPTPLSGKKLAKALGFKSFQHMLPEVADHRVRNDQPSFDLRQIPGQPDRMWVRINQSLPVHVVAQILQLVTEAAQREQKAAEGGAEAPTRSG